MKGKGSRSNLQVAVSVWENKVMATESDQKVCGKWTLRKVLYMVAAAAKSVQLCPTVQPHRWQPTRLPRRWDSPGKNSGVGCHFLLQRMKVKSESEVAQSCPTLSDPLDCSPPGSPSLGFSRQEYWSWVPLPSLLYVVRAKFKNKFN